MRIFLAGATGAIGRRLVPLLLNAKHSVVGTTRSAAKADALRAAGVEPVVVDVFEAAALSRAVSTARADIVVHQLTDLPPGLDPSRMAEGTVRNARMRKEGTENLVAAALQAGVHRLVAQSIAWMYAPGREPHTEDDPLDLQAQGARAITADGVAMLEHLVVSSPPVEGVVLRYGHLYGPGTGAAAAQEAPSLHVDAAAQTALLAIEKAHRGIYNVAEPSGYLSMDKARRVLGFDPNFRLSSHAGFAEKRTEDGHVSDAVAAAMQCLDDFMAAFNARDVDALTKTLNLPMVRLALDKFSIIDELGPQARRAIEASLGEDWDHSGWDRREVIHAGSEKVHVNARFSRYRADGSIIASYDEIDIVTREDGHWGIKCRSSFAPLIEIPATPR